MQDSVGSPIAHIVDSDSTVPRDQHFADLLFVAGNPVNHAQSRLGMGNWSWPMVLRARVTKLGAEFV